MSDVGEGWNVWDDARFALQLRYPAEQPAGVPISIIERVLDDGIAVHLRSDDGALYVEVARMAPVPPEDEYQRQRRALVARFGDEAVTKLGSTFLAGEPARTYAWRWDGGERVAIVLASAAATYRIVLDPASPLSVSVLTTVELR